MYIWGLADWPKFRWSNDVLAPMVSAARFRQGRFLGVMDSAGFDARLETELMATCDDVVKTSAIEGEFLNPASVRSSIARRLGIPSGGLTLQDRKVEGVVEMILDATQNFARPLDPQRIFGWHAALFPTGYSGTTKIDVAQWRTDRDGAMQVVSNAHTPFPHIHYEAPPAERVPAEMAAFLNWFNLGGQGMDGLTRAGLAHLWYVTIHPLDDGNGRIARAVADLAVAQMERTGQRFYSMSSQIEHEKPQYYEMLERTQKGDLDITEWLKWFTGCYMRAIEAANGLCAPVLNRARFQQSIAHQPPLNKRQQKIVHKMLGDWKGPMTTDKWAKICECSPDTAQRDMADLMQRGLLTKGQAGGRSTNYVLNWPVDTRTRSGTGIDGL